MDSITKKCSKCNIEKDIDEFYKGKHWCKKCFSDNNKNWRIANIEKRRSDNKKWQLENVEKERERKKKRYLSNPQKVVKQVNAWRIANAEKFKETVKKWYLANSEKIKNSKKNRYHANPEIVKEANKKWKLKNVDKVKDNIKKWNKANPEKKRVYEQRRRSNFNGTYSVKEWLDLCNKYNNRCLCCGEKNKLTVDHVIPISKGGMNTIDNIQPLCGSCNSKKNNKEIDYRR